MSPQKVSPNKLSPHGIHFDRHSPESQTTNAHHLGIENSFMVSPNPSPSFAGKKKHFWNKSENSSALGEAKDLTPYEKDKKVPFKHIIDGYSMFPFYNEKLGCQSSNSKISNTPIYNKSSESAYFNEDQLPFTQRNQNSLANF